MASDTTKRLKAAEENLRDSYMVVENLMARCDALEAALTHVAGIGAEVHLGLMYAMQKVTVKRPRPGVLLAGEASTETVTLWDQFLQERDTFKERLLRERQNLSAAAAQGQAGSAGDGQQGANTAIGDAGHAVPNAHGPRRVS